ncbi:hypothetical protein ACWD26_00620 [Streptomyces sp. NPDC002787]
MVSATAAMIRNTPGHPTAGGGIGIESETGQGLVVIRQDAEDTSAGGSRHRPMTTRYFAR